MPGGGDDLIERQQQQASAGTNLSRSQLNDLIAKAVDDVRNEIGGQRGIENVQQGAAEAVAEFDQFDELTQDSINQQRALLGLDGPGARNKVLAGLSESPAQQFIRQRSERALLRNSAALGGLGGGNVRSALTEEAAGFALQDVDNQRRFLAGNIDRGFNAATNRAGIQFDRGRTEANIISDIEDQRRLDNAADRDRRSSRTDQLVRLGTAAFSVFSDEAMKTDVRDLSPKECFDIVMSMPLKAWKYIGDAQQHFGPMYQQAPEVIKLQNVKALDLHDELMLIAGALQYQGLPNGR